MSGRPATLSGPRRPVVAFTGDGGLGMTLAEIETAVRLRLRIVVIVFNDAALSLIKIKQRPAGQGGSEAVDYAPVSFAGVATAMGAAAAAAGTGADLVTALEAALRRDGPTVIDVAVDPGCYPAIMELSRGDAGRRAVPGLTDRIWVKYTGNEPPYGLRDPFDERRVLFEMEVVSVATFGRP